MSDTRAGEKETTLTTGKNNLVLRSATASRRRHGRHQKEVVETSLLQVVDVVSHFQLAIVGISPRTRGQLRWLSKEATLPLRPCFAPYSRTLNAVGVSHPPNWFVSAVGANKAVCQFSQTPLLPEAKAKIRPQSSAYRPFVRIASFALTRALRAYNLTHPRQVWHNICVGWLLAFDKRAIS